jgi:trans-aconitate methyltransferase
VKPLICHPARRRLCHNRRMKKMVVGIGFYKSEQWQKLRDTAVDADILEPTYDEWLQVLDSSIEKIRSHGLEPELVDVDVEDLLTFCKIRGLPNTGKTRAKFIAQTAGKKSPGKR